MKKYLLTLLSYVVGITCTFGFLVGATGCGNKSYGMGNYNFTKVHIFSNEGDVCCKVEKWYDAEMGIEVKTDRGALFLSEGTYMLIESYCPICGK